MDETLVTIRQTLRLSTTKFGFRRGVGIPGPPGPANTSHISLSRRTVDLNPFKTIIDDSFAPVFITTRVKPGAPQYTHTILAGDIPVSPDVQDYMVMLTIGGQNTDVIDDALHWRMTINGVDFIDGDATGASGAGLHWALIGNYASAPVKVGDVIGVKFWTDVSNLIDFTYATIYIVPQTLSIPKGFQLISPGTGYTQGVIDGAVGGVTYENQYFTSPAFYDANLGLVITGYGSSGVSFFGSPLQVVFPPLNGYRVDSGSLAYDVNAGPILMGFRAGSLVRILQNYDFIVGVPTFAGTPIFEELIGTKNGTTGFDGNAVFALSQTPLNPSQIELLNKIQMIQGGLPKDYTYALTLGVPTITFNAGSIPLAGDHPFARYDY